MLSRRPLASSADLVHIHRLQPAADEGLYVATHTGLYRMDSGGRIAAVGDATHDLMGFTVAGPGDLLASGHPDLRDESLQAQGKPPLLGLVASSDGVRWKPLSLLGDVDFHSLVTAHNRVYGLDSRTEALMVSKDRRTWEIRAKGLPFTDIAVDPTNPDTLMGAGSVSVAASIDGGRSWRPVGTQQLQYLSWNKAGLFGISPDGAIVTSTDGGETVEGQGRLIIRATTPVLCNPSRFPAFSEDLTEPGQPVASSARDAAAGRQGASERVSAGGAIQPE